MSTSTRSPGSGTSGPLDAVTTSVPGGTRAEVERAGNRRAGGGPKVMYPIGWLRGIAALVVVLAHAYQFQRTPETGWAWPWDGWKHQMIYGADAMVDMFFVLSGLVVWLPVAHACLAGRTGLPGRMMLLRRMSRLLPLYLLIVLVVWALTNPRLPGHWEDLVLHLTFTHIYSDTYIFWTNGPAWTLAVEFHFYLIAALSIPVVHWATTRFPTRRDRIGILLVLPVALIAVGFGYTAWNVFVAQPPLTDWSVWFGPLARMGDFGIGGLLAVANAAGVRWGRVPRTLAVLVSIPAVLVVMLLRPDGHLLYLTNPLYALAIGLFFCSIVLHDGPWPRALSFAPLAWLGEMGFGIYMLHEPMMRFLNTLGVLPDKQLNSMFLLTAVIIAVPTVFVAWVASRTVEQIGPKLLATLDKRGRKREYYPHLLLPPGQGGGIDDVPVRTPAELRPVPSGG